MNRDLRQLVRDRLSSEGLLQRNWSALVLAACDGRESLDSVLQNTKAAMPTAEKVATTTGAGACLNSLTRQVIVFTHDERLPEAVRRLGIDHRVLAVTRRPNSVVEIRKALDPVKAHIEDAWALASTKELPGPVMRRVVPGYCRSALEAALIGMVRKRMLADRRSHTEVEESLAQAGTLNALAALALFDDRDRGGDVMAPLNTPGPGSAARAISIRTSCLRHRVNFRDGSGPSSNWSPT